MDEFRIRFRDLPSMYYASLELRGPYDRLGRGFIELKEWMDAHAVRSSGKAFALLYDNPTTTPAEKLRSEVCFPVAGPFEQQGRVRVKKWGGGLVAETRHSGRGAEYTRTYGTFLETLLNTGYSLEGPAREVFDSVGESTGPGMGSVIQQSVRRLG